MALRVLLADESTTIKKVIQLALQDYGVEVKSVPIGLDVITVAKGYKPDLIFVDVLLQKRSGYQVAQDIKTDPELTSTPVILMWSGFMEIDEAKARDSRADRRLEKPFDAEILRNMVKELVPRAGSNLISEYLRFPKLPDFKESAPTATSGLAQAVEESPAMANSMSGLRPTPGVSLKSMETNPSIPHEIANETFSKLATPMADQDIFNLPEVEEDSMLAQAEEFQDIPLVTKIPDRPASEAESNDWNHQDLAKFKLNVPSDEADLNHYMIPTEDLSLAQVTNDGDFEEVTFADPKASTASTTEALGHDRAPQSQARRRIPTAADEDRAEQILREESKAVLERIAWQILPEMCERLVKDELNKLLKDAERSIENG